MECLVMRCWYHLGRARVPSHMQCSAPSSSASHYPMPSSYSDSWTSKYKVQCLEVDTCARAISSGVFCSAELCLRSHEHAGDYSLSWHAHACLLEYVRYHVDVRAPAARQRLRTHTHRDKCRDKKTNTHTHGWEWQDWTVISLLIILISRAHTHTYIFVHKHIHIINFWK